MVKIPNKVINWFYTTWLSNLYFKLLLWLDRKNDKKYLSPKEVSQIIREYSLLDEGVKEMKTRINLLVVSKTKEDYNRILKELEDMIPLAEKIEGNSKYEYIKNLKSKMDFSNVDIKNDTDRARMIERRIEDMKELQDDLNKRKLLRDLREAEKEGNTETINKLKEELKEKYGIRRSR